MSKKQSGFGALIIIVILLLIAAAGLAGWAINRRQPKTQPADTAAPASGSKEITFTNPKKGAHFESSTPAHASTLAAVPVDVVIDFNFDLASNSTIQINKDGVDYGRGDTSVDANKLAMRRQMTMDAPDGLYTVNYTGCWPDKTCHDGSFQFAVDRSLVNNYEDRRGQQTVTIKMSRLRFSPMNLRISTGTTVTWVNDDGVEHYVNTDSHPAHSHVPSFNSKVLAKGASYSFAFNKAGAYPYHCSAHAADMTGNIVVE